MESEEWRRKVIYEGILFNLTYKGLSKVLATLLCSHAGGGQDRW